jgi:hypothetical protein
VAFNFPNSPSNGQSYAPVGGPVFTWDGVAWKALTQGMPVLVFIGDGFPAAPAHGNMWWESDTGNLFIYYVDADSGQWVQVNGTPGGFQTAETRNRIVNPAMQISQENGTASVGHAAYPADQWMLLNTTGATVTARQESLPASLVTSRLRVNTTVVDASHALAESIAVRTFIEGTRIVDFNWGTGYSKQAVLRFVVAAPVAGTYSVAVRNNPVTESWIGTYTIAPEEVGLWVWRTLVIPPCSTGTWASDTSGAMYISFTIASGPSPVGVLGWQTANLSVAPGQANGVSVVGNFFVSNVGLYLDPDKTGVPPRWQLPDEAEELRACMRYFLKQWSDIANLNQSCGFHYGLGSQGTAYAYHVDFPCEMRTAPDVTATQTHSYSNCSAIAWSTNRASTVARVTITATGAYRAMQAGALLMNARM